MVHMTEIASGRRIGLGLRKLGFKYGCVIFGKVIAKALNSRFSKVCSSLANGVAMNVSTISWHLFLRALDKQDPAGLDKWLGRWVFADDGVRLSMRPTTKTDSLFPV